MSAILCKQRFLVSLKPKADIRRGDRPQDNNTLARSQADKLLPLIGRHEAIENLVDPFPRLQLLHVV